MEQALSFFSRAEDASDVEVPAKDARLVRTTGMALCNPPANFESILKTLILDLACSGIKTVELTDPIPPAKLTSTVDDQLPSLLSMIIDGLPPLQQSKYINEAEKCLQQYVKRYPNVISLGSYCCVGLFAASYLHPGVISLDRLVTISINYMLHFLLDDLFFDTPNEFHQDQYGITHNACGSPEKIQEYLDYLDAVYSQQVQPRNPTPLIETMVWESRRDILKLSNPKWFANFVEGVIEHHHTNVASHVDIVQGRNLCFQDLESYSLMRARNVDGKFTLLLLEFARDSYIPSTLRANPYVENITMASSFHLGFTNDVFSYHKESSLEQNPCNLITVLKECEGKPFVETVHMAINLVNTYAHALMDMEVEAWNLTLQNHLQDVKDLIAGNVYFSFMDKRY